MPSRRTVLASVAVGAATLAGCSGVTSTPTPSPTRTERGYTHEVPSPATSRLRNSDGEIAVRSDAHDPPGGWLNEGWLVTAPADRDALSFAFATTGTDAARTFLHETELSEETVLVDQYEVDRCASRRLERLQWAEATEGPDGGVRVELEYERVERREDCQRGTTADVGVTMIRVPTDAERLHAFARLVS